MKGFFKNPVINFLSSLKLSAGLLGIVAIASAKATFIESDYGRDAAYDLIYAARWFEVLLALVTISLTLLFFKRWPYKPRGYGFMLVHIAIVVILISSGITRYMGYEGVMPIREGQSSNYFYSDKSHIQAILGEETDSYPVRLWKPGQNKVWNSVTLGGAKYELGVTEYWPRYEESYQPGPGGIPALQYGDSHNGEIITHTLLRGGEGHIGPFAARYLEGGFSETMSDSPYGDIRLHIDGTTCTLAVEPVSGDAQECGGYKFRVTEFQTDFKVGGPTNLEGPLVNPMIRVEITSPDGAVGERILFALHPDFSMDHGGGEDEFADLDILYQINRGIEFASGGETGLQGRATFSIQTMDMNTQEEGSIPAGQVFAVHEEVLYASPADNMSFVPVGIHESVVLAPALSENENAGSAARVVIRDGAGNEAEAVCREHARPQNVVLNGQTIGLAYAPVFSDLPYSLHLDDFVLQTYPGSDNPATYESWVTLIDEEKGIEGEKVHIYMNHPLDHRGTKHFQSSYDQDLKGTVLTVNHDPGKLPTYIGYTLISLGFLLIMLKDLIFPSRNKSSAKKTGSALAAALALILGVSAAGGASAQAHDPNDGQDHSGHNHAPPSGFVELSKPAREAAARLTIQDYRGRMKPFDTLAREMVMKIAKRSKFEGRHPVDQYLSWSLNPYFWVDKPIIGVRYPGLKDLLGVDHSVKHVSYNSLISPDGHYRLGEQVQEAHRTPDRDRSKTQRKLISFDERFQLLNMTFRGYNLKMYPVPGDENDTWLAFNEVAPRLNAEQQEAYRTAFTTLGTGVESGNNGMILDGLNRTKALQAQFGEKVIPSKSVTDAELFYNKSHLFSWMMIPLLGTFMILLPVYLWNLFRNRNARISFRNPFYTLGVVTFAFAIGGMILAYTIRWIASERIPISNGHESLLFIAISVALAGFIFEFVYRQGFPGALGGLLTTIVLGVSMLSTFDPAIGPLVPVLVSYWLNIHVTIITSSYGFLGLSALIGALTLLLLLAKGPGRENIKEAIATLDNANKHVLITGLGLLTVGTLLGGVWANESWGRYWGWDAKETWSLITILVYALVLHFRWIPQLRSVWLNASGALAAIASVVMTYFGVNYFLTGLHSYAQGDAAQVPNWVFIGSGIVVALIVVSGLVSRGKKWEAGV
ncbi:MAG: cytochrome c biogenesis protein CcsA [Candidatus Krumholzibacteriota bacterium]